MSCPACTKALPLRKCGGMVEIGEVEFASTDYFINIQDLTTNVIWQTIEQSDADGILAFDMDLKPRFFQPGRTYKLWVTVTSATTVEQYDAITITIGSASYEYDCFQFEVVRLTDSEGLSIAYTPLQVIEVAE